MSRLAQTIRAIGAIVVIPEIAHYEVRRELHRIRAVGSLRRLDVMHSVTVAVFDT